MFFFKHLGNKMKQNELLASCLQDGWHLVWDSCLWVLSRANYLCGINFVYLLTSIVEEQEVEGSRCIWELGVGVECHSDKREVCLSHQEWLWTVFGVCHSWAGAMVSAASRLGSWKGEHLSPLSSCVPLHVNQEICRWGGGIEHLRFALAWSLNKMWYSPRPWLFKITSLLLS